ncbi:hypothetical protein M0802_006622 [Mischocyttarus mexicanus]|nr:hypothetical protein M0802_006622 [Mischocyttarus mexicanus]
MLTYGIGRCVLKDEEKEIELEKLTTLDGVVVDCSFLRAERSKLVLFEVVSHNYRADRKRNPSKDFRRIIVSRGRRITSTSTTPTLISWFMLEEDEEEEEEVKFNP